MVVVIFEVWPAEGRRGEYLDLAVSCDYGLRERGEAPCDSRALLA